LSPRLLGQIADSGNIPKIMMIFDQTYAGIISMFKISVAAIMGFVLCQLPLRAEQRQWW
jgi:hypothetical protein